jgi:DNA-binding CsgD family transcriptional regulator
MSAGGVSCTADPYADHPAARTAQRRLSRELHISSNIRHCEGCDAFHVIASTSNLRDARGYRIPKRAIGVLDLLAQGYTQAEIAGILETKLRTVEWYICALKEAFGAMSVAHLMAITIRLGVITPSVFVPQITERKHDERNPTETSQRNGVGGTREPSRRADP